MQLIVGLGNPGKKYERTRHNVGRWVMAALLAEGKGSLYDWSRFDWTRSAKLVQGCWEAKVRVHGDPLPIIIPDSYMNLSGEGVGRYLRYFDIPASEMLVAYDELDLHPGVLRIKKGGSAGGHRGVESILQHLDDPDFVRLRVGIGHPRDCQSPLDVASWVLAEPAQDEQESIVNCVRDAVAAIGVLHSQGMEAAQGKFHKPNQ